MEKWFKPKGDLQNPKKTRLGDWEKGRSATARRKAAIHAKNGNYLRAARSLQALANVTKDSGTKRAAQSDANYFYRMNKKKGGKK